MGDHHIVADVQKNIGSSGRVGEVFVGLGVLILLGAIVLTGLGVNGSLEGGPAGDAANGDAKIAGILFLVEGLGFIIFGAVAILSGWDRTHDHDDELGIPHK